MQQFVRGYNDDHRHTSSATAARIKPSWPQRQAAYEQARARHPERWAGSIHNWAPITGVWLN